MSNDEMEQIKKLKDVVIKTGFIAVKLKTIDALAEYGTKAILTLTQIADRESFMEVKNHALEMVKSIKEKEKSSIT